MKTEYLYCIAILSIGIFGCNDNHKFNGRTEYRSMPKVYSEPPKPKQTERLFEPLIPKNDSAKNNQSTNTEVNTEVRYQNGLRKKTNLEKTTNDGNGNGENSESHSESEVIVIYR